MRRLLHRTCVIMFIGLLIALPVTIYAQEDPNCPGAPVPRLIVGSAGRVLPGDANNVRDAASRSGALIGEIPGGEPFDVLGGPVCADSMNWWQVQYGDFTGWTVEGSGSEYWVEPVEDASSDEAPTPEPTAITEVAPQEVPEFQPPVNAMNVLETGAQVRVINDDPASDTITLTIRAEPGRSAGGLAQALEGDLLTIIGGPEEADGLRWWRVETARGTQGWVVEGVLNGETYERTLLAVCPFTEERFVYRVDGYVATSAADGSDPCLFDRISVNAWSTFNSTAMSFDNRFVPSPDGTAVIYADRLPEGSSSNTALYRLKLDGSECLRLTNGINVNWASWSPDGQQIAVATGANIGILPVDGSSYYTLIQGEGGIRDWVEWLADSESVVFLEQDRMPDQIGTAIDYVFRRISTQTGGLEDVFDPPLSWSLTEFAISPDRTLLAVSANEYALIDAMSGNTPTSVYDIETLLDQTTQFVALETGDMTAEADAIIWYGLQWLPDGSAVISTAPNSDNTLEIVPANGSTPKALALSGEVLPSNNVSFIGWESDTVYLLGVTYGFEVAPEDRGIWAVDVTTGVVERRN